MKRYQWILLTLAAVPTLILSALTAAFFGPIGAATLGLLLLAGINTPRLFHTGRNR